MNKVEGTACTRIPGSGAVAPEVLPRIIDPVSCAATAVDVAATFLRDGAVRQHENAR